MKFLINRMILLVVFASTIVSCTKDDDPDFLDLPEKFPLSVGNSWDYSKSIRTMYKSDSTAVGMSTAYTDSTIELSEVFSEAVKDTVLEDSINVVIIKSEEIAVNSRQDNSTKIKFYSNCDDGLYDYSYIDLKNVDNDSGSKVIFRGIKFNSVEDLKNILGLNSLPGDIKNIKAYRSVRLIQYPIETGNVWDYGSISYTLNTKREVTGVCRISTLFGDFDVYEIQTFWDWGLDGEWDQDVKSVLYLSKYGFVKTRFELWNLARTDEFNNIIDYFDVFEEEVLIDYDVK